MSAAEGMRERAVSHCSIRFGMAGGLPMGAWGYAVGGWWLVTAGTVLVVVMALVLLALDVYRYVRANP